MKVTETRLSRHRFFSALALCVLVLFVAALAGRHWLEEAWYIERLRARDTEVRRRAVERLAELKSIKASRHVLELFAREIQEIGRRPILHIDTEDEKWVYDLECELEPTIYLFFERIGYSAFPEVERALRSSDRFQRAAAARVLACAMNPFLALPLLNAALAESNRDCRAAAACAIGIIGLRLHEQLGGPIKALTMALEDQDPFLRRVAASAVGHIGSNNEWREEATESLVKNLGYCEPRGRWSTAVALRSLYENADRWRRFPVGLFFETVLSGDKPAIDIMELAIVSSSVMPFIIEALESGDPKARLRAAIVLNYTGPLTGKGEEAVPALERATNDNEIMVREAAVEALSKIRARIDRSKRSVGGTSR